MSFVHNNYHIVFNIVMQYSTVMWLYNSYSILIGSFLFLRQTLKMIMMTNRLVQLCVDLASTRPLQALKEERGCN